MRKRDHILLLTESFSHFNVFVWKREPFCAVSSIVYTKTSESAGENERFLLVCMMGENVLDRACKEF